ncbi:MAG: zinc ribbon domain-containing protein [Polyangiaceae bacterium]|nr:zinc ribbon domain-containing protein [Polyangiaceae bacterium]
MPTYLYDCEECGEFEAEQSISAAALSHCPTCGRDVRRVIAGATGAIVRGGGGSARHCERETPCCGRATRCDKPPCGH